MASTTTNLWHRNGKWIGNLSQPLTIYSILFQDFVYTPKLQRRAYDEFNRSATHFSRASLMKNGGVADQTVKACKLSLNENWNLAIIVKICSQVKLPMQSVNGKRPVVELVIEQGGRYQPIKFSNNMQVWSRLLASSIIVYKCCACR